ncbi:DUF6538 domain-containing protein [Acetobacter senegalensis]|uniref:DUF6538 domain-containing protein n=1 Tax=Acetobacter senegalensis TaxID=446692 RepID=UPI00128DA4BD|nr:DUF6538 domain-containing protein [Acetobacter senegalensis]MPQ74800.1 hypothetical protein [Acetobacter senegalensis]
MKLVRLDSGYHLRRWVPLDIRKILAKNEIWHSLETNNSEIAKLRGCDIFSATSKFFIVVRNMTKSYIYHSASELISEMSSDNDKKILSKIIDTYELHVRELKSQYRLQEGEHYLERMADYQRLKTLTDAVEKSKPELEAVLEYSKNNKDFNAYKSFEQMKEQFAQISGWVKPPEKKENPSPLCCY